MPVVLPPDLSPALPEILLACGAMALLLLGVFRGEGSTRLVSWLAVAVLLGTLVLSGLVGGEHRVGFYGMFVIDAFAVFMKAPVLVGSAGGIIIPPRLHRDAPIPPLGVPLPILLAPPC